MNAILILMTLLLFFVGLFFIYLALPFKEKSS